MYFNPATLYKAIMPNVIIIHLIYLALSQNDYSPPDTLCKGIKEIKDWMCSNFFQLNVARIIEL